MPGVPSGESTLDSLTRLVSEAKVLAGGDHPCHILGHKWESQGGRHCSICENGSQTVYYCPACGDYDYGEEGGPGWEDCQTYCHYFSIKPH